MGAIVKAMRRRWWIVVLAPLLAALAAWVAVGGAEDSYRMDSVLFVPSGAGDDGPGNAGESARLAAHYSELIPIADRIIVRVAETTGWTPDEVRESVSVTTLRGTSLMRLTVTGDDPEAVAAGLEAFVSSVTQGAGGQTTIPVGFIVEVSSDDEVTSVGSTTVPLVLAAALAGLVLGVAAAVALERADVRADSVELVSRRTGVPGSDIDAMPDGSVLVLLRHWVESGASLPQTVALLGVEQNQLGTTTAVANRLADIARAEFDFIAAGASHAVAQGPSSEVQLVLSVGGAPGTVEAGEWVAVDRQIVALVVPRGTSLAKVEAAVNALRQLELGPSWLLLTDRVRRGGSSATAAWEARIGAGSDLSGYEHPA